MAALTPDDLEQLAAAGISRAEAERQLALLAAPPAPPRLLRPCTVGDGIVRLDADAQAAAVDRYQAFCARHGALRFVPASGAASRMFQSLAGWERFAGNPGAAAKDMSRRAIAGDPTAGDAVRFLSELPSFAFAEELAAALAARGGGRLEELRAKGDVGTILHVLLDPTELGYGARPKAAIPFHRYAEGARTALEEQLVEAAPLLADAAGRCRLHFTVPASHRESLATAAATAARTLGRRLGVTFELGDSIQYPATDTLALTPEGEPFRTEDGRLLLRPGGHGALVTNLAELAASGADLVFIKNIDNIQPEHAHGETRHWSAVLAGHLLDLRGQAEAHFRALSASPDEATCAAAHEFLCRHFALAPAADRAALLERLARPVRVAGMVIQRGEPGGGPFWVAHEDGTASGQIVERAEAGGDPAAQAVFGRSTHFNPVDLVLGFGTFDGGHHDPRKFVEPRSVFIAQKSHQGRPLVALEHPGLWNGAMAGWNTAFVEVPETTFAPVKTVFDLLRPAHQS